jgi:hypothetical protein
VPVADEEVTVAVNVILVPVVVEVDDAESAVVVDVVGAVQKFPHPFSISVASIVRQIFAVADVIRADVLESTPWMGVACRSSLPVLVVSSALAEPL